jgi:putative acetyltransferase
VHIRPATDEDTCVLLAVTRAAFGGDAEADLVVALLNDASAMPLVSLVAEEAEAVVGHVLLTRAVVFADGSAVAATVLAPLAVMPASQRQGIGLMLCRGGIEAASRQGAELVFVLGHPDYYPRVGFRPAAPLGLRAPYPIDLAVPDAWMALETRPGLLGSVRGTVQCADALMRPELWER